MRVVFPKEINKLVDMIGPYMRYDPVRRETVLQSDAPAEIVEAHKKYCEWYMENCYSK